jgi:hypothetical protein
MVSAGLISEKRRRNGAVFQAGEVAKWNAPANESTSVLFAIRDPLFAAR